MAIFVATSSFASCSSAPLKLLDREGYEVELNPTGRKLTSEELLLLAKDSKGLIAGTEQYSKEVLSNMKKLKVISRLGVGIDNIDMDAARKSNIKIFTTQTSPSLAVAELTTGLMINLTRKIPLMNEEMRRGKWKKSMGSLLSNKTLGIIGLGTIGKQVVEILKGFNMKILAFDIEEDRPFSSTAGINYCNLDELLSNSDFVSIHLNATKENSHLIDKSKLDLMKEDAFLINTSRGEIIDEKALQGVLKSGKLGGVALDVFEKEPYDGVLKNFENVFLTPHIGSYAREIRIKMEIDAAENLIKGLKNE